MALPRFFLSLCIVAAMLACHSAAAQTLVITRERGPTKSACMDCRLAPEADRLKSLQLNAKRGDPHSQFLLGRAYVDGSLGLKADAATGASWLLKAANGNDTGAAVLLAQLYDTGNGVVADPAQVLSWLQKAAYAGDSGAALQLARRYDTGKGVTVDPVQADAWYKKAFELGDALVFSRLCTERTQADATPADWGRAAVYCQKAGERGDTTALYKLGTAYSEGAKLPRDPVKAIQAFKDAATRDDLKSAETLAQIYADGTLAPKDDVQAMTWYRKAAELGSTDAMIAMAQRYETGQGAQADIGETARLYEVLARTGNQQAVKWFTDHPDVKAANVQKKLLDLQQISAGTILYAVASDDPRFTTLDAVQYLAMLSQNGYPARAADEEIEGKATMECRLTARGDFNDCLLVQDTPQGYGFGRLLASYVDRLQDSGNKTEWASRFAGRVLRISVEWRLK